MNHQQFHTTYHADPHTAAGQFFFWLLSVIAAGGVGSLITLPIRLHYKARLRDWGVD